MQLSEATIAVTGATGFFGRYLVEGLRARGAHVVAVVRDRQKAKRLLAPEVEVREAELGDRAALAKSFVGASAVISNAALISIRDPGLTMRTNVEGTRNVLEAMVEADVRRAIVISSSQAYPFSRRTLDESAPLRTPARPWFGNVYGVSKAESERVASSIAERAGIALTTFRPCGITGPRDPLLFSWIDRFARLPITLFPSHTEIGVVHAADLADAVASALAQPEISAGKAYNIQGENVSLWQVADAWKRAGGGASRLRIPVPVPVSLRYDDGRARRELGFRPRSLREIVAEAVAARGTAHSSV